MSAERFEILILGSGQGGKLLAWHMAQSGRRTAVVERRWIGGSCPNIACMPSKNEIWSAKVAHLAHHAGQFGTVAGPVETDMAAVRQRKRDMVNREIEAHLQNYKATGAELIMASIPGLEAARPLTHIEALELDYLPPHLIVLGSGYVGLEMAQAYRRFGSRVTVIERGPQIMSREDPDVADELQRILSDEGIRFLNTAKTLSVNGRSGEGVSLTVQSPSGEQRIDGSDLLVAAGRIPNTADIGLEATGVELDDRGYIRVNERLETSAPNVWAMGECAGSPQFTHVSVDDFRIIRDNLSGGKRTTGDRLVPYCVFTDPPLARVGLSESEAQRQGLAARVARLPMSSVLRTQTTDETLGFMKVLVGSDDRILGFTMIGSEAGEVMAAVQTAMLADLPHPKLRDAVIAHLTIAEGLGPLFSNVPARPAQ